LLRAKLQERVNTRQSHVPRGICGGSERCLARTGQRNQQLVSGNLT
jgi:hypothetical protein